MKVTVRRRRTVTEARHWVRRCRRQKKEIGNRTHDEKQEQTEAEESDEAEDKEDEVPLDLQKSKKVKTVWVLMMQAYEEEGKRGQKRETPTWISSFFTQKFIANFPMPHIYMCSQIESAKFLLTTPGITVHSSVPNMGLWECPFFKVKLHQQYPPAGSNFPITLQGLQANLPCLRWRDEVEAPRINYQQLLVSTPEVDSVAFTHDRTLNLPQLRV